MPDQVWHPYTAWEDWQSGMWRTPVDVTADMQKAAQILGDPDVFLDAARAMLRDWPTAAEHNLTDMAQNRQAWVGQATCCHLAAVPEQATRLAWWTLSPAEQFAANRVADRAVAEWQTERESVHTPTLFTVDTLTPPGQDTTQPVTIRNETPDDGFADYLEGQTSA